MLWRTVSSLSRSLVRPVSASTPKKIAALNSSVAHRATLSSAVVTSKVHVNLSSKVINTREFSDHKTPLPKYPVPQLLESTEKFLQTVQPLVTEDEFKHAQKLVSDFLKPDSTAHKLQKMLEERAQKLDNWLSDWWVNVAYLDFRLPVCIHVSPGVSMPLQNFHGPEDQIKTTAKVILGAVDYKQMLDNKTLPDDKLGGSPLCMNQYYSILNTCRVPGAKRDKLVQGDSPKHVTVIRNNHFFSVPLYTADGQPLTAHQLQQHLRLVVDQSSMKAPAVGILGSDSRDNWYKAYTSMCKDKKNKENFEEIQQSILVICMDEALPNDNPYDLNTAYLRQANNGGGSNSNSSNRYYDKTLQVIVGPDGFVGGMYEHATAEGPPILSILDHIVNNFVKKEFPGGNSPAVEIKPKRLDFNITPEVNSMIQSSSQALDTLIGDLDMTAFDFNEYGTDFIKSQKLSPDAYIQVAFQLAFYKLYGHSTATYESGALRKFFKGRTETIRSCSVASHAYCQAMQSPDVSVSEKVGKLREAVTAHRKYTDEVVGGKGIDRHFLGLKLTAIENGLDLPKLFMDPVFESSCYWRLSTSQVASKAGGLLGFGPVVPDGYGLCYNPKKDGLFIAVSAWNSCPTTSSTKLRDSLKAAFTECQDILLQSQSSKI